MDTPPAHRRLYPSRFSDRYYHLVSLRTQMERIVSQHVSGRRHLVLVDFGCGSEPYRPLFDPYVARYIGVDLPRNDQATVTASPDSRTELPDQVADIVLSTQVLEHVDSPPDYLRECHRLLKPEGLLILSTHGHWMYHPDPTDFWRWTSAGLRKLVEASRFRVMEVEGVMGLAATGVQLFQDALSPKLPRFVRRLFVASMQMLMAFVDRFHSAAEKSQDACVFVIVAAK